METLSRMPICRVLTKQQKKWLDSGYCPTCGLPKKEWGRRIDWTCCSKECTEKYQECFRVWQYWKLKVFRRDKYSCVKCGFKARTEKIIHPESKKYYRNEGKLFGVILEDKETAKVILGDESQLIGDHIFPIAMGGEEYEMDNVQTLCKKCNKIKTKEDIKKIALYRKQHPSQTDLSNSIVPPSNSPTASSLHSENIICIKEENQK